MNNIWMQIMIALLITNMSCLQDMLRLETLRRLGFASPRIVRYDSFITVRTDKVLDDSLPFCKAMQQ